MALLAIAMASPAHSSRELNRHAPPVVTIGAREYAFDAPDSIESGPTTIRLVSHGKEQHFVQLIRISRPHTLAEFRGALDAPSRPSWETSVGGVGTIPPGAEAATTLDLAAGLYALVCDMEDAKGTVHMKEGMLRALVVTEKRNSAIMPTGDIEVRLTEFAFTLADSIGAGAHLIAVRNEGTQSHMALLWRLRPGKSAADAARWMEDLSDKGPPPVTLMGGTPDLGPGRKAQLVVNLEPGHYVLICLVGDDRPRMAHYQRGMIREFAVGPHP